MKSKQIMTGCIFILKLYLSVNHHSYSLPGLPGYHGPKGSDGPQGSKGHSGHDGPPGKSLRITDFSIIYYIIIYIIILYIPIISKSLYIF